LQDLRTSVATTVRRSEQPFGTIVSTHTMALHGAHNTRSLHLYNIAPISHSHWPIAHCTVYCCTA